MKLKAYHRKLKVYEVIDRVFEYKGLNNILSRNNLINVEDGIYVGKNYSLIFKIIEGLPPHPRAGFPIDYFERAHIYNGTTIFYFDVKGKDEKEVAKIMGMLERKVKRDFGKDYVEERENLIPNAKLAIIKGKRISHS